MRPFLIESPALTLFLTGPFGSTEATLKFWDMTPGGTVGPDGQAALFTLNTRVDDPHRLACRLHCFAGYIGLQAT